MRIEFHADDNYEEMTPISVANSLINHTTHCEENKYFPLVLPEGDYRTFDVDFLEQLAEHLLVYCKHNKKEGAE